MISYLKGEVVEVDDRSITLLCDSVGYEILMPLSSLMLIKVNDKKEIQIHTHVREDQITLFGFLDKNERSLFRKLTTVSGVGPKSALTMLSVSTPNNIIRGIESGNVDLFPKIPGVGKKTLEKLILELRGKFKDFVVNNESEAMQNARLALDTLGYNMRDISEALSSLHPELDMNSLIKEALKLLSKV